jgi:hypothetical protein
MIMEIENAQYANKSFSLDQSSAYSCRPCRPKIQGYYMNIEQSPT